MTGRLTFAHPSRKRLKAWLDGTAGDQVTAHVEQCDRCAARLEELADVPSHPELADDPELGAAIREAFTPPDDLNERVMKKIGERERADREVELLLGIFAIAKDAAELMMPPVDDAGTARGGGAPELEAGSETNDDGVSGDDPDAGRDDS